LINEIESNKIILKKSHEYINELNNNLKLTQLDITELLIKNKNNESIIENLNKEIKKYERDLKVYKNFNENHKKEIEN
jgi:hypothetical protein